MRTFLLSSFPTLSFDGDSALSFSEFLEECARHLSKQEVAEVDAVCSHPPSGKSAFAQKWQDMYSMTHEYNVRKRSADPGLEKGRDLHIKNDLLRTGLDNAWQADDPLKRELTLMQTQWDWLDQERRKAPFTLTDILGYALQLQFLERRQLWQETEGTTLFKAHTQSFLEPVLEEIRTQDLSA